MYPSQTSSMVLGPPVCRKCMVIGSLIDQRWKCPRCGDFDMKDSLFIYAEPDQRIIRFRTRLVAERTIEIMRYSYTAIRPFMIPGNDESEPNLYYRPWLETNVGRQGRDWEWDICGTDIDYLEIYFAKKESATLFELKWP